ncbi:MAG: type IVB secretion system protein IcmQ [Gammaproteobacteria bacterium]|nr:type IVB secretion system protein IcmQ [Gammaproteobacteria bacterium]
MADDKNKKEALLELVRQTIAKDEALREEFQVGNKFRFIRDRLIALQANLEENLAALEKQEKKWDEAIETHEALVYIYLYNAQGQLFSTWQKMVTPSVFYEYSVNRPVYSTKADVDAFIRSKSNKSHHGYLTIAVNQADILNPIAVPAQDTIGQTLIRVREGAFNVKKVVTFTHNNHEFYLNEDAELVRKPS